MAHISFKINESKFNKELDLYEVPKKGRKTLISLLPSLEYAERVLWVVTGIKKCSSFEYKSDVDKGRVSENHLLEMFDLMNLSYNSANQCFPESTVSQKNWAIDEQQANMDLPYRERDQELARWFGYPQCCVQGYRKYFDQVFDNVLSKFPLKNVKTAEDLDTYAYPNGKKDPKLFKEVGNHLRKIRQDHPNLFINRRELIEPIRTEMKELYEDNSFYLLLHFCLPVHNPNCQLFREKTSAMYSVLKRAIGEHYANAVVDRTFDLDQKSICF